jgi:hypothetical protein
MSVNTIHIKKNRKPVIDKKHTQKKFPASKTYPACIFASIILKTGFELPADEKN